MIQIKHITFEERNKTLFLYPSKFSAGAPVTKDRLIGEKQIEFYYHVLLMHTWKMPREKSVTLQEEA